MSEPTQETAAEQPAAISIAQKMFDDINKILNGQPVSDALLALIHARISAAGGWIPFSEYMRLALYAPGLGYYSGGATKGGQAGDFVTAPELCPQFGTCVAATVVATLLFGTLLRSVGRSKLAGAVA